jgi:protein-S-isoprenylcysteine O-methyltransferase Ste14
VSGLELKIPPVLVFALTAAAMYGLARALPAGTLALPARVGAAATLAACGVALAAAGVAAFRRSRTSVHPHHPERASAMVAHGVYRWTRNPMYLGLLLVLAGWAVLLANAAALAALPLFVLWMNRFQIGPEERVLAAKFGPPYAAYLRRVRRWL